MLKPIELLNNEYFADEQGNIYSKRKKKMKPHQDKNGYLVMDFRINKKRIRGKLIHRLIALTFISNPNNLPEINHKDENKLNNCVDNLEWCDRKYNMNYGTARKRTLEKLKNLCLKRRKKRKVLQFTQNNEFVKEYNSTRECENFGFNHSSVCACCNNKKYYKTYKDFIWRYKENELCNDNN